MITANSTSHPTPLPNQPQQQAALTQLPNDSTQPCIVVGYSIEAISTATVLASMGNIVHIYTDIHALQGTLETYTFEHEQQALWQLYVSQKKIAIYEIPANPIALFNQHSAALYWLFYTELPEGWRDETAQDNFVEGLNQSGLPARIPVVLSGTATLGKFAAIAQLCKRPWVYYVPFVFLQDGRSYASMLTPKLWLMGEKTEGSVNNISVLQPLIARAKQSHIADIATIEFSRSAIISMLATRVSFMNEWSRLADYHGVDITEVASIMGLDGRIGKSYLQAGWGFGGHSLPTEISALIDTLDDTQVEHRLIQTVKEINDDQKELIFRKFWQYFDGMIDGKSVCIWGGSYKAGSGRTSSSAIHPLLRLLWSYDITTYIYAAEAKSELLGLYANQPLLKFINQPTDKLDVVDALFIMVWSATQPLPISAINNVVVPVFDAQNAFSTAKIKQLVGDYHGIGRKK